MKKSKFVACTIKILLTAVFLLLVSSGEAKAACRFWAAISDKIPKDVILEQLLNSPNCLKVLGKYNNNGWGIGYYDKNGAELLKGAQDAFTDNNYNDAVNKIAGFEPKIIVAHVRKAASGCRDVENPHPFKRYANNKQWLFGHNGVIDKEVLIKLIGQDYLNKNSPNTCNYNPPDSWVDSELYFIFLLKNIEKNKWNVEKGIINAITDLNTVLSGREGLNFFLTDGQALWVFRRGPSLYYYFKPDFSYSVVASSVPYGEQGSWVSVPENSLIVMRPGVVPELTSISK